MKQGTHIVLCLIGFVGLGVLLYQLSAPEVWQHVLMMGWGYVPVIGLSLVVAVHHAWIWRACFDRGEKRPRLRQLLWVQLAGEAVGNVAPASQVGKEVGKAIVMRDKMCVSRGVSSLVINKTGEMIGGVIFCAGWRCAEFAAVFMVGRGAGCSNRCSGAVCSGDCLDGFQAAPKSLCAVFEFDAVVAAYVFGAVPRPRGGD